MAAGRKTGGRQKGTPNKATASLKGLAQQYTDKAVATLAEVMRDITAPAVARVSAANALLDRGHGKPRQEIEHTGKDGAAIAIEVEDRRRRVSELLEQARAEVMARHAAGESGDA